MTGPSGRYNRECELLEKTKATKLTREKTDRPHCEALLDVSQDEKPLSRVIRTTDESLCAWTNLCATPSIVSQAPRKRKQKDEVSRGVLQQEEVNRLYQPGHKSRSDKFDLPFGTLRRCVETTSWQYAPNNAQYRRAKSQNRQSPDYTSARRVTSKYITAEQKELQREIQQELRRQYEKEHSREQPKKYEFDRDSRNSDTISNDRTSWTDKTTKIPKNNSARNARAQGDSLGGAGMQIFSNESHMKSDKKLIKQEFMNGSKGHESQSHLTPNKHKVGERDFFQRAGGSENSVDPKKVERLLKQLPPIDVSLASRGHRPGAYLSSRLSIMEEEMRRDFAIRSSQDDSVVTFRSPSEPTPKTASDRRSYMHPVLESLFTIKSLNHAKNVGLTKTGRSYSHGKIIPTTLRNEESPNSTHNSAPNSGTFRLRSLGPETHDCNRLSPDVHSLRKQEHNAGDWAANRLADTVLQETHWGLQDSPPSRSTKDHVVINESSADPIQTVHNLNVVSGKGLHAVPATQRIL